MFSCYANLVRGNDMVSGKRCRARPKVHAFDHMVLDLGNVLRLIPGFQACWLDEDVVDHIAKLIRAQSAQTNLQRPCGGYSRFIEQQLYLA